MTDKPKVPRCEKCGFRIRGPNHKKGRHHKLSNGGRRTGKKITQPSGRRY